VAGVAEVDGGRAGRWLGWTVEVLVAALLAFAPLAYGTVEPWSEQVVVAGAAALALAVCLRFALDRSARPAWTRAYAPVALFVGLVALQLVPLPEAALRALSPGAAALRAELLGPAAATGAPLSLYPYATAHDLRLLLAAVAVFAAVVNVYWTTEQVRRLLVVLAAVGGAVGLLALAQDLTGATNLYWVGPAGKGDIANSGPFFHYSHYGQFANLSIGATLGLLFVQLHPRLARPQLRARQTGMSGTDAGWAFALALSALSLAVTVLWSGSRTAMTAGAAGAVFAAAGVARARGARGRGWVAAAGLAAAAGLLLAFGSGAALERWGTLASADSYRTRLQILSDLPALWSRFPVLGSGLGTHETLYPMFDRSDRLELKAYAECEYAQVLSETGAVGLLLVLAFVAIVGAAVLRAARRGRPPVRLAAIGLGYGVVATLVHSAADFGQHLPANALPMAATCGLAIVLSRLGEPGGIPRRALQTADEQLLGPSAPEFGQPSPPTTGPPPALAAWVLPVRWAVVAAVALVGSLGVRSAVRAAAAAELAGRATHLRDSLADAADEDSSVNQEYAEALDLAAQAAALEPANVKTRYLLGTLRYQSVTRVRDPETAEVIFTAESREHARRMADDLRQAAALCPTYGRLYGLAGQIRFFALGDRGGADDVRRAAALSRSDSLAAFLSARLDADASRWDAAAAHLARAAALGVSFDQILDVCLPAGKVELAESLAGPDYARLTALGARLQKLGTQPEAAARVRRAAAGRLAAMASTPDATADVLGSYAEELAGRGEYGQAADVYRRAVAADYAQPDRHLALARALAAAGRYDEALRAARACAVVSPGDERAAKLVAEYEKAVRLGPTTAPAARP
jgi:tetratricopeptide (TPR) repeat protein